MNILDFLLEANITEERMEKFKKLYPFFREHVYDKNTVKIDNPGQGAGYLLRGYCYYKGLNDEDTIMKCINTLNNIEQASKILGIRNLGLFDDIIDKVLNGKENDFIKNTNADADAKIAEKEKNEKEAKKIATEKIKKEEIKFPKRQGETPSFNNQLIFKKGGKDGTLEKQEYEIYNPNEFKSFTDAVKNNLNKSKDIDKIMTKLSDLGLTHYWKTGEVPIIIEYKVNGRGPYYVYTSNKKQKFNIYQESKDGTHGMYALDSVVRAINKQGSIEKFMKKLSKKIGTDAVKKMSNAEILDRYYDQPRNKDWIMIIKDLFKNHSIPGVSIDSLKTFTEKDIDEAKENLLLTKEGFMKAFKKVQDHFAGKDEVDEWFEDNNEYIIEEKIRKFNNFIRLMESTCIRLQMPQEFKDAIKKSVKTRQKLVSDLRKIKKGY